MRAQAFPGEDPMDVPLPETVAPTILELARPDRTPPGGVVRFRTELSHI
jgi:hypothetical protein